MTVLSIDLASRRYADNGIALMHGNSTRVDAQLIRPESLGLDDTPEVHTFADAIAALAEREGVPVGTLKSWVRRGILRMRAAMAEAGATA